MTLRACCSIHIASSAASESEESCKGESTIVQKLGKWWATYKVLSCVMSISYSIIVASCHMMLAEYDVISHAATSIL